jgi:hypothetical protein
MGCATWPLVRSIAKSCSIALAVFLATLAMAEPARADASAWAFAGAGAMALKEGTKPLMPHAALTFDIGVGTTPDAPVIFGGLGRITTFVDVGTDAAILGRVATRGFQGGRFGVAFDIGAYQRLWGAWGRGVTGGLSVGFPLGFTLSLQGLYGTQDALAFGAVAGIDFLRLTVYRQFMTDRWQNPYPAQEVPQSAGLFGPIRF